jgi:hypothetical protein
MLDHEKLYGLLEHKAGMDTSRHHITNRTMEPDEEQ